MSIHRLATYIAVMMLGLLMNAQQNGRYEYWLDSDPPISEPLASSGKISLVVPCQGLEGAHFFNFRAIEENNSVSGLYRSLIYLPPLNYEDAKIPARIEVWIDSAFEDKETYDASVSSITLPVNALSTGAHFVNIRPINEAGLPGAINRSLFYIPPTKVDYTLDHYEIWFDADEDNHITERNESFILDISELTSGLHFLNIWGVSVDGAKYIINRSAFYVPDVLKVNIGGYKYWFNDDEGFGIVETNSTIWCQDIQIPDMPVGKYTFTVQPLDLFGNDYGEPETFEFEITALDSILGDDADTVTVYSLNGVCLLRNGTIEDLKGLPKAIYIVNGKKILIKD